jgi:hypothetical protein
MARELFDGFDVRNQSRQRQPNSQVLIFVAVPAPSTGNDALARRER